MKTPTILIAEDDCDDRILISEAFAEANINPNLQFVENGEELMQHLNEICGTERMPDLILLDLNMPKKDGRVALKEIMEDQNFCHIPVIIFTTSKREDDKSYTKLLGAKNFISKPSSFTELVGIIREIFTQVRSVN